MKWERTNFKKKQINSIANFILITGICLLTFFKCSLPNIILPEDIVPMLHRSYSLSLASILRTILIIIFFLINFACILKPGKN